MFTHNVSSLQRYHVLLSIDSATVAGGPIPKGITIVPAGTSLSLLPLSPRGRCACADSVPAFCFSPHKGFRVTCAIFVHTIIFKPDVKRRNTKGKTLVLLQTALFGEHSGNILRSKGIAAEHNAPNPPLRAAYHALQTNALLFMHVCTHLVCLLPCPQRDDGGAQVAPMSMSEALALPEGINRAPSADLRHLYRWVSSSYTRYVLMVRYLHTKYIPYHT